MLVIIHVYICTMCTRCVDTHITTLRSIGTQIAAVEKILNVGLLEPRALIFTKANELDLQFSCYRTPFRRAIYRALSIMLVILSLFVMRNPA